MAKTIIQKIVFKNIPIATLYNTYMNAKEHSACWLGKKYFAEKTKK